MTGHAATAGVSVSRPSGIRLGAPAGSLGWPRAHREVHDRDDPAYGIVQGDPGKEVITPLKGDPLYIGLQPSGDGPVLLEDVRLLAPVIPRSKVVAVGRNYADHVKEMGGSAPPEQPMLFLKPNTAVVGPFDPVVLPSGSTEVSYEGELAVVIKTIYEGGDGGARGRVHLRLHRRQRRHGARPGSDRTGSGRGPRASTRSARSDRGSRPSSTRRDLRITTTLDGAVKQDGTTADMVHGVASIIEYASAAFTLLPGDVILTGTPAGVGPSSRAAGHRRDRRHRLPDNTFVRRPH